MEALRRAAGLLLSFDPALLRVVVLSIGISVGATAMATLAGLPLGAALAMRRFACRDALVLFANALLGLPPVVVGLTLYLLLSRAGPLGWFGLLYTPAAMLVAQFLLALPIVVALAHRACSVVWRAYGDELLVAGPGLSRSIATVLMIGRAEMLTVALTAFGRTISEVGAIIIVGGNIAGYTRTMTTTIVFETGRGNVAFALALGGVLISISLAVSAAAFALARRTGAFEEEHP
ncbi:MAG TPA: ABC transporter permease [Acetobacteraceae bacterium]|nr:ABC transporter permease [Acetobacteraceae bacterium]